MKLVVHPVELKDVVQSPFENFDSSSNSFSYLSNSHYASSSLLYLSLICVSFAYLMNDTKLSRTNSFKIMSNTSVGLIGSKVLRTFGSKMNFIMW